MDKYSFIGAIHSNMIEMMYDKYIQNPESVEEGWRNFFQGFEFAKEVYSEEDEVPKTFKKEFQVINLIDAYRKSGHLFTKTNPVRERRKYSPTLDIENFGLEQSDLETIFLRATKKNWEEQDLLSRRNRRTNLVSGSETPNIQS